MRSARGATLIDILVGLALLSVAGGGIFAGFKGALDAWALTQQVAGEQHNARVTLDWFARRVRMAGAGYAGARFAVADRSDVVFLADTNGDGRVECYRLALNPTDGVVYVNSTEAATAGAAPPDCSTGLGQPLSTAVEARRIAVTGLTLRYFDLSPGAGTELAAVPLSAADRGRIGRIETSIVVFGFLPFVGPTPPPATSSFAAARATRLSTQITIR
jgi:type II secretory pathway pseudopilin PulG